jgi:serine/threonine protein kinase
MALAAGTTLGPYEIISLIGAGGMGEVYRARDTRLKRRWLTDPSFKDQCDTARAALFESAMGRIQTLAAKAIDALEELLSAKKHPPVRLGAARTIVEVGLHQHEAATILSRLAEIEAAQRVSNSRWGT